MTIFYRIPEPNPVATPGWVRSIFTSVDDFKKLAAQVVKSIGQEHLPPDKPHWHAEDFIGVLIYAFMRGVAPHHASQKLNKLAIEQGKFVPEVFADGRHSRYCPHQTQINDWLRLLDLKAAIKLSKAIFGAVLRLAKERKLLPRVLVLEYDMTLCGYWGRRRDIYIIGTTQVKGAKHAREYHAAVVHAWGVPLYVALDHVTLGQSKEDFLLGTARWLKNLGFKAKWALVDRAYYSYGVLAGMKAAGVNVIVPAKNYPQLAAAKESYLLGQKGRVQAFWVSSGAKVGAKVKWARCWLVLYSDGSHPLDVLRWAVRNEITTVAAASREMVGLITTASPQGHGRAFPARISALYQMRWQVETAFREEKVKHCPWKSDVDATQLVDKLGRLALQDAWQLARKVDPRGDKLTLDLFRDEVVDAATCQMNA